MAENSVFLSYRREVGFPWARLVWEGLKQRSINVFLDIESMRSAGRFDDRLLNQIAARPYFAAILTAGTLERCTDPNDWMRREIEHAITNDRIIVPIFVAPFDVASFPPDIPENIAEALATSNGVTVYSQYLEAAIDALAEDLLTPVAIPQAELTAADQDFEMRAELDLLAQGPQPDDGVQPPPIVWAASDTQDSDAHTNDVHENDDDSKGLFAAAPTPPNHVSTETQSVSSVAAAARLGPPPGSATSTTVSANTTVSGRRPGRRSWEVVLASVAAVAVGGLVLAAVLVLGNDDSQPTPATSLSTVAGRDTSPPDSASPQELGRQLDRLELGDHLGANDRIVSAGKTHELRMTDDGQLVMSGPEGDVPMAPYEDQPGAVAIFQSTDGNFVVYRSIDDTTADDVVHSFGTANLGGVLMRVVEDSGRGAIEIVAADGTVPRVLKPQSVDESSADTVVATSPSSTENSVPTTTTEATEPADACRALTPSADPPLIDFEGSDRDSRRVVLEPGESQAFTLNVGFSEQEIEVTLSPLQQDSDALICIIDSAGELVAATTSLGATTGPLDIGKYRVVIAERGAASAAYDVQFVIPSCELCAESQ